MTGALIKKSFRLAGHATSVALEAEFWAELQKRATAEELSLAALIGRIDEGRGARNLASTLRVYVLSALLAARAG